MGLNANGSFGFGDISTGGGGGGSVNSVTGLNTDNTDPANPIVQISVDGSTITGAGTPASPLVANIPTTNVVGIEDGTGGYTYFTNLTNAMASAVSGQTITFFADVTESGAAVDLKDGVDINFNGYTFTNTNIDGKIQCFTINAIGAVVRMYNGLAIRDNVNAPLDVTENNVLFDNKATTILHLNNVTFQSTNSIAYYKDNGNDSEIYGGIFIGEYADTTVGGGVIRNTITNIKLENLITRPITDTSFQFSCGASNLNATNCIFEGGITTRGGNMNSCTVLGTGDGLRNQGSTIMVVRNCTLNDGGGSFIRMLNCAVNGTITMQGTCIVQNCSVRGETPIFMASGNLNYLNGCSVEATNGPCVLISNNAGDNCYISNCALTNVSSGNPIIEVQNSFTGIRLEVANNFADSADATQYFIESSLTSKNAKLVNNVVNGVVGFTNFITNIQVTTQDNFGNVLID